MHHSITLLAACNGMVWVCERQHPPFFISNCASGIFQVLGAWSTPTSSERLVIGTVEGTRVSWTLLTQPCDFSGWQALDSWGCALRIS